MDENNEEHNVFNARDYALLISIEEMLKNVGEQMGVPVEIKRIKVENFDHFYESTFTQTKKGSYSWTSTGALWSLDGKLIQKRLSKYNPDMTLFLFSHIHFIEQKGYYEKRADVIIAIFDSKFNYALFERKDNIDLIGFFSTTALDLLLKKQFEILIKDNRKSIRDALKDVIEKYKNS